MSNPFEEISQKLDRVLADNQKLLRALARESSTPSRIPFPEFCKEHNISRPTGYAWNERGLIELEKIGGRQYVLADSIIITKKYQRDM